MKRILALALFLAFAVCLRAQEPLEFSRTFLMPGRTAAQLYDKMSSWTNAIENQGPFCSVNRKFGAEQYKRTVQVVLDDGLRDGWWLLTGYDVISCECNLDCYEGKYVVSFSDINSYTGRLYGADGVLDPNQFHKKRVYNRISKIVDNLVRFFDDVCDDVSRVMESPTEELEII